MNNLFWFVVGGAVGCLLTYGLMNCHNFGNIVTFCMR